MIEEAVVELDMIEELRLRRWAREHHVPASERNPDWHPVILDEMCRKDQERLLMSANTSIR